MLLTEPGLVVSLEQLVDRVWGEAPPRGAGATLHSYLSRLRGVLSNAGGPRLARRSQGYALEMDPGEVDLYRFRGIGAQARAATDDGTAAALWDQALDLWHGVPFEDLDSDWLRAVGVGWQAERRAAILDRNDVLLRCGQHAQLLPELTTAAAAEQLDERLAGQLMLALYRCGRQTEALEQFRHLRQRLIDELGNDPGPELRELHQQILRQDLRLDSPARAAAGRSRDRSPEPVTGPLPLPAGAGGPGEATGSGTAVAGTADACADLSCQLPCEVAGFTGRATQLRQLDALLEPADNPPDQVVIATIGGCAGIGKTALAVHWAHRARHRFPDGQLYVDLRGYDPARQAMHPDRALRTLLELLRVPPEEAPGSIQALAGWYRSRLSGKRVLVVLDNARNTEQVRPLLPGTPGSMVVVTSRDQLTGLVTTEGAHPVSLDVLDHAEARQLLVRRLGSRRVAAEAHAVDHIIDACAGLPLALAIVAARAATQPGFPLVVFADELAGARGRLDALASPDPAADIRAVFSWSYQVLHPPAATLFTLLGLHPGPDVSVPGAARLADVPAPQARRLLAELTGANLLTEYTPGRFAFHDLLRAYAAELAETVGVDVDRQATAESHLWRTRRLAPAAARTAIPEQGSGRREPGRCQPL